MKNVIIGLSVVALAIGIGALIMKAMKNKVVANIPGGNAGTSFGAAAKGMTNKEARLKSGWNY